MINLSVHGITEIKVEKTHKVMAGSYAKVIKIKTDEINLVEITMFASEPEKLKVMP